MLKRGEDDILGGISGLLLSWNKREKRVSKTIIRLILYSETGYFRDRSFHKKEILKPEISIYNRENIFHRRYGLAIAWKENFFKNSRIGHFLVREEFSYFEEL